MQQRVEILKALYRQADILILDEPTGVLTPTEADHLFRILEGLKEQGKTIILITHKLREIMEITDTVSVMRRGEMTATVKTSETSPEQLAELMVGRKVLLRVDKKAADPGKTVLEVENLNVVDEDKVRAARRNFAAGPRRRDPGDRGGCRERPVGTAGGAGRDHPWHWSCPDQRRRAGPDRQAFRWSVATRTRHRPCARGSPAPGPDHGLSSRGRT